MKNKYSLTIGWLYPDLMSTYGDRGNILILSRKCEWSNIDISILPIQEQTKPDEIKQVDMVFGGGSQDIQQEIVMRDLTGKKGEVIKNLIEKNIPALFVCGSPQIMGKYYEPAVGKKIEGLGIFDITTVNPGPDAPRCIGNIVAETELTGEKEIIVGFENHGGRTYLGNDVKSFAKVIHGYGNNGEDKTEGVRYKNAVGCYFHGPILSKNSFIGDYLIKQAIKIKYGDDCDIKQAKSKIEEKAKQVIIDRYVNV